MRICWVVKLGGSLFLSERLPFWLETLAGANVVIVPGGGPFADQVRTAQARWRFDDRTAHAMAILAMAQYGWMLAGLCPRLRVSATLEDVRAGAAAGHSVIWTPALSILSEPGIPASWDVTSDSLSAWLAGRLGSRHLLLIKSAQLPGAMRAAQLAAGGWVDRAFPSLVAGAAYEAWWCGPQDLPRLSEGLRRPESGFTAIAADQ